MAQLTSSTVQKIRVLLASWTSVRQKTHVFHWNITGSSFNELHKYFEELYDEAVNSMDSCAERLRQVGVLVEMSLKDAAELSVLGDAGFSTTDDREMVIDLIRSYAQLTALQNEIYSEADEVGDYVTADLMTQLSKTNELRSWFLSSWLGEQNQTQL
jgi:starvation-inducible DNA-binding protein